MTDDPTRAGARRNRGALIAILVLFFGSMLVAGALRFSGWMPQGSKSHGEVLSPPVDLREQAPQLLQGGNYAWSPDARTWRVLLAPPDACGDACARASEDFDKVWRLMGRNAERLDILWLCADAACEVPPPLDEDRSLRRLAPDPALRARLPGIDQGDPTQVRVYLVDPNGFLMMRYPPGADVGGVRADIATLLKLI
jgi:hypothetical protein